MGSSLLLWGCGSPEKSQDPDEGPIAGKEGQQAAGRVHRQYGAASISDKLSFVTGERERERGKGGLHGKC